MTRQPKRRAARKARTWDGWQGFISAAGSMYRVEHAGYPDVPYDGENPAEVARVRITEIQPQPRAGKRGGR